MQVSSKSTSIFIEHSGISNRGFSLLLSKPNTISRRNGYHDTSGVDFLLKAGVEVSQIEDLD